MSVIIGTFLLAALSVITALIINYNNKMKEQVNRGSILSMLKNECIGNLDTLEILIDRCKMAQTIPYAGIDVGYLSEFKDKYIHKFCFMKSSFKYYDNIKNELWKRGNIGKTTDIPRDLQYFHECKKHVKEFIFFINKAEKCHNDFYFEMK
jgi:hypothetical protein